MKGTSTLPDPPFLGETPPHWVTSGIWTWLSALAVASGVTLALVRVSETVSGRFVLVPEHGSSPIRVRRDGVVTAVRGEQGGHVAAGATLFVVRSSFAVDRGGELRSLEAERAADSVALDVSYRQRETVRQQAASEDRRLRSRAEYLHDHARAIAERYALARELADSAASGVRKQVVTPFEASRFEFEAGTYADELDATRRQIVETGDGRARLLERVAEADLEFERSRGRLQASVDAARDRIDALQADLFGMDGTALLVAAPCAGTLLQVRVGAPGAVVREGDTLADIACEGDALKGELTVPESGVPLVQPGQTVRLRLDAFPYQRFGVRFGDVRWLGPSGDDEGGTRSFRALIDLRDTTITVGGRPRPLLPGMGGRADVFVGRRRLASYLLEPIRAARERFAEPPR